MGDLAGKKQCSVDGCIRPSRTKGMCGVHYNRTLKHGSPTATGYRARKYFEEVVLPYAGDDCLIWPLARNARGYGAINIDGKTVLASRAVCIAINGEPPTPEHQAAHSCGNGHLGCVNPRHLRWATPTENQADRIQHGTIGIGIANPQAKLTEQDILDIRQAREAGEKLLSIATRYSISIQTVSSIYHRKVWAHV